MTPRLMAALGAMLLAFGASAQVAVLGDVNAGGDSDHFETLRLRTGVLTDYESFFRYAGVAVQNTHYERSAWHRDSQSILVLWRNQHRDTLAGTIAEAGLVRIDGRIRPIGDATWSLRPRPHTGIELLAAGDLVETTRALDRAIAHTFLGISGEQQLSPRVTVIGLAGYQRFTDGNARVHLRGRLIVILVPQHGISAQLRVRQYGTKQLDVDDAYFNPGHYREWQAGLAMRKRYAGWIWSGTLATGRESFESVRQTTKLAELRAEGSLGRGTRIVLHGSYNRSAGFVAANGYWDRVIGVTLIVPLHKH